MTTKLAGKIALVTGGSSGLGLAAATRSRSSFPCVRRQQLDDWNGVVCRRRSRADLTLTSGETLSMITTTDDTQTHRLDCYSTAHAVFIRRYSTRSAPR
jgi:short-subunit dehydrogenase involved in D-alanine esterification of teichoic acids